MYQEGTPWVGVVPCLRPNLAAALVPFLTTPASCFIFLLLHRVYRISPCPFSVSSYITQTSRTRLQSFFFQPCSQIYDHIILNISHIFKHFTAYRSLWATHRPPQYPSYYFLLVWPARSCSNAVTRCASFLLRIPHPVIARQTVKDSAKRQHFSTHKAIPLLHPPKTVIPNHCHTLEQTPYVT